MVLITIVIGAYKPTYNWGAPPCTKIVSTSIFWGYYNGFLCCSPFILLMHSCGKPYSSLAFKYILPGEIGNVNPGLINP